MDDTVKRHLSLGREHYEKREFDLAEQHLRAVQSQVQRFADVHNMLGVIEHDRANFAQARDHFETALSINPNYTEAQMNLAVTFNELGLYDDARHIYERMTERVKTSLEASGIDSFARGKLANLHAQVARAYADYGMLGEAAAEYRKALSLCPDFADLRTALGNVLRESGDLEGARREYEDAVRANPNYVNAYVLLGMTHASLGERDAAEASWKRALEIAPDNKSATVYLRMLKNNTLHPSEPAPPVKG